MATLNRLTPIATRCLSSAGAAACLVAGLLLTAQNAPAQTSAPVLPTGAQVVQGNASFVQNGKQLQVTNTPGAIINWQSFGIAPGHSTYFQQQSANSSVLNQVVTNNPSQIFGMLGSNGRVILVNPSGIVVGAGAVVDTAGFIASTLGLAESNSALSRLRFAATGQTPGSLQVDGIIRSSQGDIILIAPSASVSSAGVVKATDGTVMLAAGQQVLLTGRGLDGIALQLQAPTDQAINLGRLEGNAVGLFGSQLRNTGVIQANTAELVGGRVVLRAVDTANLSGVVSAAGTGTGSAGGLVTVEGREVTLQTATVDASGTAGGGTVLIGGGWQGRDASIANSRNTSVDAASKINVSGVGNASAGKAVVWSDGNTRYSGLIDARGGATGGNGGQVEVSGKENLAFDGMVRVNAPNGVGGSILLDPKNIDIQPTGSNLTGSVTFGQSGTTNQTFFNTSLQTVVNSLAGGTLTLQATNDINISSLLTFSAAAGNVNLEAGRSVNINANVSFPTGNTANLTITANSPNATPTSPYRDAGLGDITFGSNVSVSMGGTGTTLKLLVGNGAGGGGVVSLGNVSNVGTLIVDNAAVAGGSTGGVQVNSISPFPLQDISERIFLRTALGSIGTPSGNINFKAPLISVSAVSGSVYLQSGSPLFLGPAPELGGAAANVSGLLYLAGSSNNIGVRGTQAGSGAVTAGQLEFNTGAGSIYSDSTNVTGPLVVTAGGIKGAPDVTIGSSAVVTTSLVVGTGGIDIGGSLLVDGSGLNISAPGSVTSLGDVRVAGVGVGANKSNASLLLNGSTGLLQVLDLTNLGANVNVFGGSSSNASASLTAKTMVVGTATGATTFYVYGGFGANSRGEIVTTVGDISVYGVSALRVGDNFAGAGSFSRLAANAGKINIFGILSGSSQIDVKGGSGNASYAEMTAAQGLNIEATNIYLTGGSNTLTRAVMSTTGPVNITATTSLYGGGGAQSSAMITSSSATSFIGSLFLNGGAGNESMATVSTSATITATGPVTFNTSTAGIGSHALIYAGGNGVAFTIANGYTPTLAVSASSTAAPLSGVIVPPADIAISVVIPSSGVPGGTVSATVTFSNPGIITTTFTPTLVVDGVTTTFAQLTLAPNATVTTVTTVLLGVGSSTTVASSTGKSSWPEVNLANNTTTSVVTLPAFSDLQVFVLLPANAIAGTTVSATVTFTNQGPSANTFTPTVAVNGVTQTLAPVTLPSGGTYTTTISVPVGTAGFAFIASGTSTVADPVPGNNSVTANGVSLVSDIRSITTLAGSAIAGTTVSAVVTYTNLGNATTTFTPVIVNAGFTQTLPPVTLAPSAVFATSTVLLVGTTSGIVSANFGTNTVPEINTSNNFSSAALTPLLSDISTSVSVPSTANANTTVSGIVTFTNLGGATTTFTPLIALGGVTQSLANVTLAPGQVFSTTTVVLVGASGNSLAGGVSGNTVPDANASNDGGSAFVAIFVPPPPPPPPPPVVTPTVVVTPTIVVTPIVVVTPTVVVNPPPAPTPTVVVTPPAVPTPTVVVTPPVVATPTLFMTPTVVVTPQPPTPTAVTPTLPVVVVSPPLPVVVLPALTAPTAVMPLQLAALFQQNVVAFVDVRQLQLLLSSPFASIVTFAVNLSDLPICPRR